MFNKRGQELSTNTVIILVLAVLVLVFIIIGFSVGWNKIFPFINPPNNVKEVGDKCALACSTEDKYGFCSSERTLKLEADITGLSTDKKLKGNCYDLAGVDQLGIASCASISCDAYSNLAFARESCEPRSTFTAKAEAYKGKPGVFVYKDDAQKDAYASCEKKAA